VALASLSGESDAAWARAGAAHAGVAFLGGLAVDDAARAAARDMVARGREEFLPADPVAFVDRQLRALADAPIRPAVNVRSATRDPLRAVATTCAERGAAVEVNAHCRQAEMCAVGCGERLLRDPARLAAAVRTVADAGATTSVKLRAEVDGVDLPALARRLVRAGADWLHVDAMDAEPVVADVARAARAADPSARVIANNGVRDAASVAEYRRYGADAVSVGRASDDPAVLAAVRAATEGWDAGTGADAPGRDRSVAADDD
jgi:TIM-barrel protein